MASKFFGSVLRTLSKASLLLLFPVTLVSTCSSCHPTKTAESLGKAQQAAQVEPIIKGRVLIDPEFSGPERELILRGIRMWTNPLSDVLKMEVSDNPGREAFENDMQQRMNLTQERAASGLPEPKEDEEDTWVDPHSKWNSFDPRAPFWSMSEGCSSAVLILRFTSDSPVVKAVEKAVSGNGHGVLYGHTNNSCHRKAIMLVADRLKTADEFTEVFAHEFGHVLGLRHDFESDVSIMHPEDKSTRCVTRRDVSSFCARWNCPKHRPYMSESRSCG